ncbi:MAG TPA: TorF family putative porin [Mariprofundaceae bacterium]|nr:TorF family putative porin [Mariprofundaceae bacterium]
MKNKMVYLGMLIAGVLGMGTQSTKAQAEDLSIAGDIGVASQYVWRGVPQTASKAAVQGDLSVAKDGFSGSVWFSNSYASPAPQYAGKDVVEFDWTLDYSGSIGDTGLGYSVGGIYYSYLYDSPSNFGELYAGISYDAVVSPSLTAYYNVKGTSNTGTSAGFYKTGDIWVDASASGSLAGFDLSGTVSYAKWKKDAAVRPIGAINTWKDGLSLATVAVSKDVKVGDSTMTSSLTYTYPLAKKQADGNRYIYGLPVKSEFIAAVNFSY